MCLIRSRLPTTLSIFSVRTLNFMNRKLNIQQQSRHHNNFIEINVLPNQHNFFTGDVSTMHPVLHSVFKNNFGYVTRSSFSTRRMNFLSGWCIKPGVNRTPLSSPVVLNHGGRCPPTRHFEYPVSVLSLAKQPRNKTPLIKCKSIFRFNR